MLDTHSLDGICPVMLRAVWMGISKLEKRVKIIKK